MIRACSAVLLVAKPLVRDRGASGPGGRPAYLTDHGAAGEEIGRLRWMLTQVIALADDAPRLADEQLRDRLLALADQARPRVQ